MANGIQDPIGLGRLAQQIRLNRQEGRQSLLDDRNAITTDLQQKRLSGQIEGQRADLDAAAAGRQQASDLQAEIRNNPNVDPDLTSFNFFKKTNPQKASEFESLIFKKAGDLAKATNDPSKGIEFINAKTGSNHKYLGTDPDNGFEKADLGDRIVWMDKDNDWKIVNELQKGVKPGSGETITVGPEGTTITRGGAGTKLPQTKGRTQVDKDFSKEFISWRVSGGASDFTKQLSQLNEVIGILQSGKNVTGPVIGSTPKKILGAVNPEAVNARELVEEVVQRNLRLILGAQFTEKEGERLIARAYNPNLEEEVNVQRVGRLMTQMKLAAESKGAASNYFEEHGTLTGFTGKIPTIEDFNNIKFDEIGTKETVLKHPSFGDVSEEDIQETMKANNLTREQVLERLGQ